MHAEVPCGHLHLGERQRYVAHTRTVATDILAYLLRYVVPVLTQGIVRYCSLTLEGHYDGQVVAVHGTAYLPVEPGIVGISILRHHKHHIVGLLHQAEEVRLHCRLHQVIVLCHEVDALHIEESKAVGITLLPIGQEIQRMEILLMTVSHGIHIECQIRLVIVHSMGCFDIYSTQIYAFSHAMHPPSRFF